MYLDRSCTRLYPFPFLLEPPCLIQKFLCHTSHSSRYERTLLSPIFPVHSSIAYSHFPSARIRVIDSYADHALHCALVRHKMILFSSQDLSQKKDPFYSKRIPRTPFLYNPSSRVDRGVCRYEGGVDKGVEHLVSNFTTPDRVT